MNDVQFMAESNLGRDDRVRSAERSADRRLRRFLDGAMSFGLTWTSSLAEFRRTPGSITSRHRRRVGVRQRRFRRNGRG